MNRAERTKQADRLLNAIKAAGLLENKSLEEQKEIVELASKEIIKSLVESEA